MKNPISRDMVWGATSASLSSASIGHILRLLELGWTLQGPGRALEGRDFVAIAAVFLYGALSIGVWLRVRACLWGAVFGPMAGVSAVVLIPGAHVDLFQVVLGLIQIWAFIGAVWLLWVTRVERD